MQGHICGLILRHFYLIIHDLTLLDNFEKVLCYQYPGVFNDPKMSRRIGEKRTIKLYQQYQKYMNDVKRMRRNNK